MAIFEVAWDGHVVREVPVRSELPPPPRGPRKHRRQGPTACPTLFGGLIDTRALLWRGDRFETSDSAHDDTCGTLKRTTDPSCLAFR